MLSSTSNSSQWIAFGFIWLFSSVLLVLASSPELSLNEIRYTLHKRGSNEPARLHNFNGGIKRSLSTRNRKRDETEKSSGSDDTKNNKTSTSTSASDSDSDENYDLIPAYFTPNASEAHALLSKKLSVKKWMEAHRTDFIACCSETLVAGSEQFQKNETFGWFHFQQDFEKSKIIDEVIVTVDVACYEVSQYDPTGENPGSPISDFTQDVIDKLKWTKEKAKEDAQKLRKAFANQSSSNSTSTAEKNTTGSGVQKSEGDNSKKEDDTTTEEKKPTETTSQTSNDASKKKENTTSETSQDNGSSDETSTNESSTTNDSSEGTSDFQKSTDDTNSR